MCCERLFDQFCWVLNDFDCDECEEVVDGRWFEGLLNLMIRRWPAMAFLRLILELNLVRGWLSSESFTYVFAWSV